MLGNDHVSVEDGLSSLHILSDDRDNDQQDMRFKKFLSKTLIKAQPAKVTDAEADSPGVASPHVVENSLPALENTGVNGPAGDHHDASQPPVALAAEARNDHDNDALAAASSPSPADDGEVEAAQPDEMRDEPVDGNMDAKSDTTKTVEATIGEAENADKQLPLEDAVTLSDAGSSTRDAASGEVVEAVATYDQQDGSDHLHAVESAVEISTAPARVEGMPSIPPPRLSRQASIEAQLELLMSQAAEDMDSAELLIQLNAKDRQVSLLKHEIEQLRKSHEDLMNRMEQRQESIEELRAENQALKTVNRSLVEDAAAYHTMRSTDEVRGASTDATATTSFGRDEMQDSAVASLDTSRSASTEVARRSSENFESERKEYQSIISELQSEVKGLNLYFNKITARLARGDSYLERMLVNDPESDDESGEYSPASQRTVPAAKRQHNTFPTQLPSSFTTSSASAAAAAAGAFENLRSAVPELMRKRPSLSSLSFFKPAAASSSASEHGLSSPASPLMIDSTSGGDSDGGYYPSSPASWFQRMSLFAVGGGGGGGSSTSAPTTPTGQYMPTSPFSSDSDENVVQMAAVLQADVSPPRHRG
ncbi:hypothetical protein HDU88_001009 [Geranomyces variabilis]|nr:hypothetical protein HDU88_001009 [Geranomyces variabilis]